MTDSINKFDGVRGFYIDFYDDDGKLRQPAPEKMHDLLHGLNALARAHSNAPTTDPTTPPKTRAELITEAVEAEARGDFKAARTAREAVNQHDADAMTTTVVDYERGPHNKRTRIYLRGKLVGIMLDD